MKFNNEIDMSYYAHSTNEALSIDCDLDLYTFSKNQRYEELGQ